MDSEMIKLLMPLVFLQFVLMIVALVSCLNSEERTRGPKGLWVLLIICLGIVGPVLYFVIGRERT